jgi:hypothetical protein
MRWEFVNALNQNGTITVIPIDRDVDGTPIIDMLTPDVFVSSVVSLVDGSAILDVMVQDAGSGAVLSTMTQAIPIDLNSIGEAMRRIARQTAATLGQPFGAIEQIAISFVGTAPPVKREQVNCYFLTLNLFLAYSRDMLDAARSCMALPAAPDEPGPLAAARAFVTIYTSRYGDADFEAALQEARVHADAAMSRSPEHWLARSASYTLHACAGDLAAFRAEIAPHLQEASREPDMLLDIINKLAMSFNRFDEGAGLMRLTRTAGMERPWSGNSAAMLALREKDAEAALAALPTSQTGGYPEAALLRLAAGSMLQQADIVADNQRILTDFGIAGPEALARFLDRTCWSAENRSHIADILGSEGGLSG